MTGQISNDGANIISLAAHLAPELCKFEIAL
jgi:hypothetical protein